MPLIEQNEKDLKARNRNRYKYLPSFNTPNHVSNNLLARNFTASNENEKQTSDILVTKNQLFLLAVFV